jgi:hypothetical protein
LTIHPHSKSVAFEQVVRTMRKAKADVSGVQEPDRNVARWIGLRRWRKCAAT